MSSKEVRLNSVIYYGEDARKAISIKFIVSCFPPACPASKKSLIHYFTEILLNSVYSPRSRLGVSQAPRKSAIFLFPLDFPGLFLPVGVVFLSFLLVSLFFRPWRDWTESTAAQCQFFLANIIDRFH